MRERKRKGGGEVCRLVCVRVLYACVCGYVRMYVFSREKDDLRLRLSERVLK